MPIYAEEGGAIMELTDIKGVGAKTLEKLGELGVLSAQDLIDYLPSHYIDFTKYDGVTDIEEGKYAFLRIRVNRVGSLRIAKRNLKFFKAEGSIEDSVRIELVWFNQPYMRARLENGEVYAMWGKLSRTDKGIFEMINPNFELESEARKLKGIMPIYRTKGLISQSVFRGIVKNAAENVTVECIVKRETERKFSLMPFSEVYRKIHAPDTLKDAIIAEDRLAVNNCVERILAFKLARELTSCDKRNKFIEDGSVTENVVSTLPFELSPTQRKAIDDIICDMKSARHMNRILLGDVGTGKTIVAFVTMYYAVMNGYQCSMMAPTEILSRQHYASAMKILAPLGVKVALLNASMTKKEREEIITKVNNGKIDILIGTHSLLSEEVTFCNLGYVVIDELHKFGVKQKGKLEDKMNETDSLVMSATPIPRSVALMYYGDLDVSKLEKRHSSSNVKTYIVRDDKTNGMYSHIAKCVRDGRQAYIVCPLVEDDEGNEIYSAKELYTYLRDSVYSDLKVGLVYGKMKEEEKSRTMDAFARGDIDVLVATTVIEVGIDVKNATEMIIMNANRFGLATLHQLRGRIGRDGSEAECFLHVAGDAPTERLGVLKNSSDGFEIAEYDLDKRGCGDYLGVNQSGGSKYTFIINKKVIALSKAVVESMIETYERSELTGERISRIAGELVNITAN